VWTAAGTFAGVPLVAPPAEQCPATSAPVDVRATLRWYRHGRGDPTTLLTGSAFARASWTPDGPATVLLDWTTGSVDVSAWGPGAPFARQAATTMLAVDRPPPALPDAHTVVTRAARDHAGLRTGASGDLYHQLLPTVIAQRITAGEAVRQWKALCHALGEPAPGPLDLLLPPDPARLAGRPAWWFHPFGIEAKRARTLAEVARVASRLWDWGRLPAEDVAANLQLLRGIGPWTIGSVLGPVCGDDDAVPVGDYHLPNIVAWNLAGEARGDDHRMLELLEPYRGQRGRALRLLALAGDRPPAFGPRRRILPMHRW
jgi:3-methyladenine DNA glycosylase/8-oxoguanine DNA glycosylase